MASYPLNKHAFLSSLFFASGCFLHLILALQQPLNTAINYFGSLLWKSVTHHRYKGSLPRAPANLWADKYFLNYGKKLSALSFLCFTFCVLNFQFAIDFMSLLFCLVFSLRCFFLSYSTTEYGKSITLTEVYLLPYPKWENLTKYIQTIKYGNSCYHLLNNK